MKYDINSAPLAEAIKRYPIGTEYIDSETRELAKV